MKPTLIFFPLSVLLSCNSVQQLQKLKRPVVVYSTKEAGEFNDAAIIVQDSTGKLTGLMLDHNLNAFIDQFTPGDTILK
jgi:hypothetical protein